ncbi:hypothetical protein RKE40_25550 [Bosea sp. ZW T0_25]|jgi:hypothetical protein|uniref:Uncharacterized protein n=1 Tax=Bosea rubneri TaxID=3075434 RepID=A0ABU3SER7_9HYPH|nr:MULTISPECIES: hypothetical protein [unclassified Bosea (in: a-proteobacteria)]MDU0343274.1 hypothetical protein [Bosea sp. ZW T0_25]HEV7336720.1 hypothetical protein [Bosea sp. (in: a-proteobacteria)]
MTIAKRVWLSLAALVFGVMAAELGERSSVPGVNGYMSSAAARVGRPMTPVSVAGAARRTTRRCATGVYNC